MREAVGLVQISLPCGCCAFIHKCECQSQTGFQHKRRVFFPMTHPTQWPVCAKAAPPSRIQCSFGGFSQAWCLAFVAAETLSLRPDLGLYEAGDFSHPQPHRASPLSLRESGKRRKNAAMQTSPALVGLPWSSL